MTSSMETTVAQKPRKAGHKIRARVGAGVVVASLLTAGGISMLGGKAEPEVPAVTQTPDLVVERDRALTDFRVDLARMAMADIENHDKKWDIDQIADADMVVFRRTEKYKS